MPLIQEAVKQRRLWAGPCLPLNFTVVQMLVTNLLFIERQSDRAGPHWQSLKTVCQNQVPLGIRVGLVRCGEDIFTNMALPIKRACGVGTAEPRAVW
jgi:hypothetical protein